MKTLRIVNPDGSITELKAYDATGRDLHIDGPLSELLINYRPVGFIADRIFPVVDVGKQSDVFYEFTQADLYRIPDTRRSPLTAAKMVDLNVTSQTYYARNWALATGIALEDAINADEVLNLRENKARFVYDLLMLDWENRVSALVINSANVSSIGAPSSLWSDHTNSDPITVIDDRIEAIRLATGYKPNRIVFGEIAWRHFKRNAEVRKLLFPAAGNVAGPGIVREAQVSNLFDIEDVLIGGVMKNTAAEGLSQTLADIWGPHVLLYYAPPRPSKEQPSYGYAFRWRRPGLPNMTVENLGYDRRIKGELIEVGYYQDEKITGKNFAAVISSVSAT